MKIDLEFVELHSGLFLSGINFGTKLYPDSKGGLTLYYDTELEHTVVIHKNKVALIESTASKTLKTPSQIGIAFGASPAPKANVPVNPHVRAQVGGPEKFTAQVETPIDKPQKKSLRPAKYQGEEV